MRKFALVTLVTALASFAVAKDHSNDYQMGIFVSTTAANDGTITSTLHGDGTSVAGDVSANQVGVYGIKVDSGMWYVTTLTQSEDSMLRQNGDDADPFQIGESKSSGLAQRG
jgi:hypothetical protein